jgi:elongation factor G
MGAKQFVPIIELQIAPARPDQRDKLAAALLALTNSDPQFRADVDEITGLVKIAGVDERQLSEIIARLQKHDGINLKVGPPQIAYRETISRHMEQEYTHKKLFSGSGQFACVKLIVEPNPLGDENAFRVQLHPDALPESFVPAIQRGVESTLLNGGPLAGFPVIRVTATLIDGKYHDIDSTPLAFEIAARQAIREALGNASPILLEPIMKVEIEAPEAFASRIVADLKTRRARIEETGRSWIIALVPAANLLGYSSALKQITGNAEYTVQFEHYAPVAPDPPPFAPAIGLRA